MSNQLVQDSILSRVQILELEIMSAFTQLVEHPDLIIGLVGPIGVDLEFVQIAIEDALKGFSYITHLVKITDLMVELEIGKTIDSSNLITSYNSKIDFANTVRARFKQGDILSALAISAISRIRNSDSDAQGQGHAYIVRQLKTPDEVKLFRSVYGRQFILVSIYSSPNRREEYLTSDIGLQSKGAIDPDEARVGAIALIERDRQEDESFGQNVSGTFHQGDLFIDLDIKAAAESAIDRFFKALFGANDVSPTGDEYAMYLAKSASLRSIDLSRQVGAAIFAQTGEVISLGTNEVPRAGGGTYWTGDPYDSRDMIIGYDPNELEKVSVFSDIIARLFSDKYLSTGIMQLGSVHSIMDFFLEQSGTDHYKDSKIMDIIEFGRIIHAEMSAITDAARAGNSIRGGTLYCTTFPCHLCAKHIVSSGIKRVVYLEPYPKSYAAKLHSDSIQIDDVSETSKVSFNPFMGISPYRYRDLFEKGKRKSGVGKALKWKASPRRPLIDTVIPSHHAAEAFVVSRLGEVLASFRADLGRVDEVAAVDVFGIPERNQI